jgi:hypothetical protein
MPRYLFTVLAFFVFLIAYTYEEHRIFAQNVSPETILADYRDLHTISSGMSPDGSINISEVIDPPRVSHYMEIANHGRNLRAFLAPNKGGVGLIYIEQARPHKFFAITGAFSVLPETVSFMWTGPMTLVFYGISPDETFTRYALDLKSKILSDTPVMDPLLLKSTVNDTLTAE